MGFHVILNNSDDFKTTYVDNIDELIELELNDDTVIYEGRPEWKPIRLGENRDSEFGKLVLDWCRAGKKAEKLFYQLLKDKYILERITQDKKSINHYYKAMKRAGIEGEIKRGDFIIRDVFNLEIEVKCYDLSSGVFKLDADSFEKHLNMKRLTGVPVLFAIFKRIPNSDKVDGEDFYMISCRRIEDLVQAKLLVKEEVKFVTKRVNGEKKSVPYQNILIPVEFLEKGTSKIEHFRQNITIEIT